MFCLHLGFHRNLYHPCSICSIALSLYRSIALVCAFSILDVVLDAAPRAFPPAALFFGIPAEAGTADVAVVGLFGLGGACGAVFQISSDCRWWVVRLWDGWCVMGFDVSEKCSVERGAGSSGVGVPDMSMMVVWFCLGYIRRDCFIYYSTKFEGRRGREKDEDEDEDEGYIQTLRFGARWPSALGLVPPSSCPQSSYTREVCRTARVAR